MDSIVLIMVLSIYAGAIAAPISLFILARRTGHGPAWQAVIGVCAACVWLALLLGFFREFVDVEISRELLELAGAAAVVSFAVLGIVALVMVTRPWPNDIASAKTASEARFSNPRFSPFAADIE